jgi:hypothetical protein
MAVIGSGVATLLDVLGEIAPDGSQFDTAEVLTQNTEVLQDMTWMEGNLVTGHRDSVRTALPTPSFRAINEGVPVTKGATAPIEETCALLEDFSQCDRELALLSGNPEAFRLRQARPHMIGFAHTMTTNVFYGNSTTNPKGYMGLAPRYNSLSTAVSQTAANVINAGGTGSALRSIWLVGWSDETITGLYPKGTIGGLQHEDATSPAAGSDAMALTDANGNLYMGYRDHWVWRCGLMVKDWRYAVRIANIDPTLLTYNAATGPDLQDLMIRALETIQAQEGVRLAFYVPRVVRAYLRRQLVQKKNAFLSLDQQGGSATLNFDGVPIRRIDALNTNEAQVS